MLIKAINIITSFSFGAIRSKITYFSLTINDITKIIFGTISGTTYIYRFSNRVAFFI